MERVLRRLRNAICLLAVGVIAWAPPLHGSENLAATEDGLWRLVDEVPTPAVAATVRPWVQPQRFQGCVLDPIALEETLDRAPLEFTRAALAETAVLTLPMPDGSFARFRIVESPVMAPELAAKFPQIKTYLGRGIDDPAATLRCDWTPAGFHAQIRSPRGSVYIDPYWQGDRSFYASYYKRDLSAEGRTFECLTAPDHRVTADTTAAAMVPRSGDELRTYRLACAATGEYTAFHGGTVLDGMSAIVTAINRVTGLYESELAIRMELVSGNADLVYTNSATDPYTNYDGYSMLGENQANITTVIGRTNYDIGHVFSTGGGGVAYLGVVCSNSYKARGVTGLPSPTGDPFYVDYVAHEMGHQFGGNHSFNGVNGSCGGGNRNWSTAYEPGSGATIMAYAGICGADNLQYQSDAYFHSASFDEIIDYSTAGYGNICPVITATGNDVPTVDAGPDYTIPKSTPFVLTATGSDPDGDVVTYDWEERDLGPAAALSAPDDGQIPLFRCWDPTTDPSRTFPRLSNLLNNTTAAGERLPSKSRNMAFRVVARDNRPGGGGVATDDMTVTVIGEAGPFYVTNPNTSEPLSGAQTVMWYVAGTDTAPIDVDTVNILLSTDGGQTFPVVLAGNTPNDGSEPIVLPEVITASARVKVEAVGNIFFDVSNYDFAIVACSAVGAPLAEVSVVPKNRYISFIPGNNGVDAALRIIMVDLPTPFEAFEGESRWVGPPQTFSDSETSDITFEASALQCEPHFMDWGGIDVLHVYGPEIVPNGSYDVQAVHCDYTEEANFSSAVPVDTGTFGDIIAPFEPPSGEPQPTVLDVASVVDKVKLLPTAPPKVQVQLFPNIIDPAANVGVLDVATAVDALKELDYPFAGPVSCPP